MSINDFENFVETTFKEFMEENKLVKGSIAHVSGYSATVTKNKHGFFDVKYTKIKENV